MHSVKAKVNIKPGNIRWAITPIVSVIIYGHNIYNPFSSLGCVPISYCNERVGRSQWPCGLRRRFVASWDVGSNPVGDTSVCLLWVLCVVTSDERRADHSFREVLPTVVRRRVWSWNLMNEEVIARVGPQRHKKKTNVWKFSFISASTPHHDAPSKSALLPNVPVI
jgi:hypothetical protein